MEEYYINKKHGERLNKMILADGTRRNDMERICLFYIIAGVDDLYFKRSHIYDFRKHIIKNCLEEKTVDFSSGIQALVRLGFNLHNGYRDHNMTPLELFWHLDGKNRLIAQNAIRLRFPCQATEA